MPRDLLEKNEQNNYGNITELSESRIRGLTCGHFINRLEIYVYRSITINVKLLLSMYCRKMKRRCGRRFQSGRAMLDPTMSQVNIFYPTFIFKQHRNCIGITFLHHPISSAWNPVLRVIKMHLPFNILFNHWQFLNLESVHVDAYFLIWLTRNKCSNSNRRRMQLQLKPEVSLHCGQI